MSDPVRNAKYTSSSIQNNIVVKNKIVNLANTPNISFCVITDETADIYGIDKHSSKPPKLWEDILGFTLIDKLNAPAIATQMLSFMTYYDIDIN